MRFVRIALCAVILAAPAAGCAGPKRDDSGAGAEQKPPKEIAETLFAGFRDKNTKGLEPYFSRRIAPALVAEYMDEHGVNQDVGDSRVIGARIQVDRAQVDMKYAFRVVRKKGKEVPPEAQKDQRATARLRFERDGKQWRIRTVGDEKIDEQVEKNLFIECLNVVMDTRVVEEYYREGHAEYAGSKAELNRIMPLQINACGSLDVVNATGDDYLVVAKTNNDPPCEIRADSRGFDPRRHDQCGGPLTIPLAPMKRIALPMPARHNLKNTDSEITAAIFEHAKAMEDKNFDKYMNSYHKDSPQHRNVMKNKDAVKAMMDIVAIKTDIREAVVVRKSDKEATVRTVETVTAGKAGGKTQEKTKEFNTYLLKKDSGKWKIFDKKKTGEKETLEKKLKDANKEMDDLDKAKKRLDSEFQE